MQQEIESQDVALENNGGSAAEGSKENEAPQKSRREIELELELNSTKGEATKWKRIATRAKNQIEKEDAGEEEKPESTTKKPEDSALLQKLERMALRQAGLTDPKDMELARSTAKKWNMEIDEILDDPDFKVKLERQQADRQNAVAVSNVRGGQGTSQAKNTPAYWIAKGTPPTAADISDRKTRATIVRAMMAAAHTNGKTFYND